MKNNEIHYLGNIFPMRKNRWIPFEGKVYSIDGISPSILSSMSHGTEPKILITNDKKV